MSCKNQYSSDMTQIIFCWRPKDHLWNYCGWGAGKGSCKKWGMRRADTLTRAQTRETPKPTLLTKASEQAWCLGLGSGLQLGGTWRGHPLCPAHSPRWEVRGWALIPSAPGYLWQLRLTGQRPALATLPLTNPTAPATLAPQTESLCWAATASHTLHKGINYAENSSSLCTPTPTWPE